ncbi:conserved hypothetical protein [Thermotomaculum hydrothermale]|uniref:VWFA domain-containing protein n=1 Tax=Thermotomaculum hydrothermale TaxID=981385 RepID=A0A7R6PEK0_9BACT|nr:DUF58 domain-containing protein [Thermotomaculum hydrothermale]BBB32284.1 conserved hypothetical protein [Thermotomaculum hydrothermale]
MKAEELLKKVRRIQIKTKRLVDEAIGGEYHSIFKGRGLEFAEVREYIPGDDVRTIDWNVTARMNFPFVKRFKEERELTIMLIVDISPSMNFGNNNKLKRELLAEICALIGFSAIENNDRVGLIAFSGKVEKFITPKKGSKQVLAIIRDLLELESNGKTDIKSALEYFLKVQKKKSIAFLVSDFHSRNFEKQIALASMKHDLIPVRIYSKFETDPPKGVFKFLPLEGEKPVIVDFSSKKVREVFKENVRLRDEYLFNLFNKYGMDYLNLETSDDIFKAFHKFFNMRKRKLKR